MNHTSTKGGRVEQVCCIDAASCVCLCAMTYMPLLLVLGFSLVLLLRVCDVNSRKEGLLTSSRESCVRYLLSTICLSVLVTRPQPYVRHGLS